MFASQTTIKSPYSKEPDGTAKAISIENYKTNFGGTADLSSRTPFARIWTGIELVEPAIIDDTTPEELFAQIKRTLWHEIAHYYGLDHGRIDALEHPSS